MNYPSSLEELIFLFQKLPGVGRKGAERLSLHLLYFQKQWFNQLIDVLGNLDKVQFCAKCHGFCFEEGEELCTICLDSTRDFSQICVVETYRDLINLEKSAVYHGLYHILKGKISPIEGIDVSDLEIDSLKPRLADPRVEELIFATSSGLEGDMTMQYVLESLGEVDSLKISRLARGIPIGTLLEHAELSNIIHAIQNRELISKDN